MSQQEENQVDPIENESTEQQNNLKINQIESNSTESIINTDQPESTTQEPILEVSVPETMEIEQIETQNQENIIPQIDSEVPTSIIEEKENKIIETIKNTSEDNQDTKEEFNSNNVFKDSSIEIHAEEEEFLMPENIEYSALNNKELIDFLEKQLANVRLENVSSATFKYADASSKEIKHIFDAQRSEDFKNAKLAYIQENGNDEGFEYEGNPIFIKADELHKKIRETKTNHFNKLEKQKEDNFKKKTEIIENLRVLANTEDSSLAIVKENIQKLKIIQQDWKDAGNIAGPHNNTLWQTYHALVDRFYSNRSIYFELLELDRKKNLDAKIIIAQKIEAILESTNNRDVTSADIDAGNSLFSEYKHLGPAAKEANELVWQRFKGALDELYTRKKALVEKYKETYEETYNQKLKVTESLALFTSFNSESINEWIEQSKAIEILQTQWNEIKGPMPREKGKDISKSFWDGVKQFYRNKSEFFRVIEAKRQTNLEQKTALCVLVEEIVANQEDSADATKRILGAQEEWRKIGQVPDKFKNKIYDRFKAACDLYFKAKRDKNQEVELEFIENLKLKNHICEQLEAGTSETSNIDQLNNLKEQWKNIGFVPKNEITNIQKRFVSAVNTYLGSIGQLSKEEVQQHKVQSNKPSENRSSERNNNGNRRENYNQGNKGINNYSNNSSNSDGKGKLTSLQNELATLQNNLEFFAKSKNADKLKADFEKKIQKIEAEIAQMKK